jgi:hypothetical protein
MQLKGKSKLKEIKRQLRVFANFGSPGCGKNHEFPEQPAGVQKPGGVHGQAQ